MPALHLSFLSRISSTASGGILPRPTSISVPAMARTILRRKRSALISRYHRRGSALVCTQQARRRVQMFVFTWVWSFEKEVKSRVPSISDAASFIALKSMPGGACHAIGQRKGSFSVVRKYRYVRSVASKRACASGSTCHIFYMAMSRPSIAFRR